MTPKEKALELVIKFQQEISIVMAIKCALITVDEILLHEKNNHSVLDKSTDYWQEVKEEIKNL